MTLTNVASPFRSIPAWGEGSPAAVDQDFLERIEKVRGLSKHAEMIVPTPVLRDPLASLAFDDGISLDDLGAGVFEDSPAAVEQDF